MDYNNKCLLQNRLTLNFNDLIRELILCITNPISELFPWCIDIVNTINRRILIDPINIYTTKTSYNFKMIMSADRNEVENDIYYLGRYDTPFLNIIRKLIKHDDKIIEVGANSGFYSLFISKLLKQGCIYCLEKNDKLFDKLQKNIFINSINNINIIKDQENNLSNIDNIAKSSKIDKLKLIILNTKNILKTLSNSQNSISEFKPAIYIKLSGLENPQEALKIFSYITDKNIYSIFEIRKYNAIPLKKIEHAGDLLFCENLLCMTNEHIDTLR